MTKREMRNLLLRRVGIGVKVITISNDVFYFFYEDFTDENGNVNNGIDRARKHFRHGEHLIFFKTKWAQQLEFKEYLVHYQKLRECAKNYPDNLMVQEQFETFEDFIVKRLVKYTGFSARKAKNQVLKNSISFNKFTGEV